jgi:hypothetical protein
MTENAYTQAEVALVDKIVAWSRKPRISDIYKKNMVEKFAESEVKAYAHPEDQEAAAQAVIQLVKERLNANP